MKQFIKRKKLLSILIIITIIVGLISIFLPAILDNNIKQEITNNIITLITSIKGTKTLTKSYIYQTSINNILSITVLWSLGISIIGIPILIIYYIAKLLTYSLELVFLIINYKQIPILFIPIYSIPYIINILIYFILIYYAISFSIILIKHLFFKKNYQIKEIMKAYIKLYFILLIGIILNTIIDILIIPSILKFFLYTCQFTLDILHSKNYNNIRRVKP